MKIVAVVGALWLPLIGSDAFGQCPGGCPGGACARGLCGPFGCLPPSARPREALRFEFDLGARRSFDPYGPRFAPVDPRLYQRPEPFPGPYIPAGRGYAYPPPYYR